MDDAGMNKLLADSGSGTAVEQPETKEQLPPEDGGERDANFPVAAAAVDGGNDWNPGGDRPAVIGPVVRPTPQPAFMSFIHFSYRTTGEHKMIGLGRVPAMAVDFQPVDEAHFNECQAPLILKIVAVVAMTKLKDNCRHVGVVVCEFYSSDQFHGTAEARAQALCSGDLQRALQLHLAGLAYGPVYLIDAQLQGREREGLTEADWEQSQHDGFLPACVLFSGNALTGKESVLKLLEISGK